MFNYTKKDLEQRATELNFIANTLEKIQKTVQSFISELMILANGEREFIRLFTAKDYRPGLLFNDDTILERIRDHPMAIWKMREHSPL